MATRDSITVENTRLLFSNFAGEERQFNSAGQRNTCIVLPDALAKELMANGWNVGSLEPREEEAEEGVPSVYFTQLNVRYDNYPPEIYVIKSTGRTLLTEETVETLDYLDVKSVDVVINPYPWSFNGKTGTKGYVKKMYVTLDEDELDAKYADIPVS